jgi:hypothetical protein
MRLVQKNRKKIKIPTKAGAQHTRVQIGLAEFDTSVRAGWGALSHYPPPAYLALISFLLRRNSCSLRSATNTSVVPWQLHSNRRFSCYAHRTMQRTRIPYPCNTNWAPISRYKENKLRGTSLYRPSDRRLSAKLVPTSAERLVSRSQRGGSPTAVISVFPTRAAIISS